jgi:hypothetical protein
VPTLQIEHRVGDYDRWKMAFDGDPVGRGAGGVRSYRIARSVDDPNLVLIELAFDELDEARAFQVRLEELWMSAGPRLGLESPSARVVDVVVETERS